MTNHIFIDESQRGDWFVVAGLFLRDVKLSLGEKNFLRKLHATDDRKQRPHQPDGERVYENNLRRVVGIIAGRPHKIVYSVSNLVQPVRLTKPDQLRFAGLKAVLFPFMPFFGVGGWRIVIERFGEFEDASGLEGREHDDKVRRARKSAVRQYLLGDVSHQLNSLYGLERNANLDLSFTNQENAKQGADVWLGATDYLAYAVSDVCKAKQGKTSSLEEQFEKLNFFRAES